MVSAAMAWARDGKVTEPHETLDGGNGGEMSEWLIRITGMDGWDKQAGRPYSRGGTEQRL